MAQLANVRKGWENEHFAAYILSKFSFIANPATVADDVGSDFFCTLFQVREYENHALLVPRNSFAIQIKSSSGKFEATNKIEYFRALELPFFLGVVDPIGQGLTMYSGEYLPLLFSYRVPTRLWICPADEAVSWSSCFEEVAERELRLKFPVVAKIDGCETKDMLKEKVETISELCTRVHEWISSRTSREYVFELGRDDVVIFAGPTSVVNFSTNFQKRLAEAFCNIEWILDTQSDSFSIDDFRFYERVFLSLKEGDRCTLPYLERRYESLKQKVDSNDTSTESA